MNSHMNRYMGRGLKDAEHSGASVLVEVGYTIILAHGCVTSLEALRTLYFKAFCGGFIT